MKNYIKAILFFFLIATIAQSCSRKKDTFLSRNFHALGTRYNILYNGDIALEQGKLEVNNQFTENFWELLPVERMSINNDIFLPGENRNSNFERAEEKAIKAIQKHGMNIKGKEKNYQIDEAYLLLGKSRYYDQRFVPALAAFNNILNKYPTSDKINQVKIWREKAEMRLNNNEIAIKKLKRLLQEEAGVIQGQDLADASATLAQAYINIKAKDSAISHLGLAAEHTKVKSEKARYHFIRGQLFNEFGKKDSANIEFDAIIEMHRKVPRAFYVNAHIEKSKNFDTSTGDLIEFKEYLTELEENRENRPFLDKIYYRIAEFHKEQESDSLAEVYYNKSLRKVTTDSYLKALDYETVGNMYFDRNVYATAGAYYDSTMTAMDPKSRAYRRVKKKRENLDDVIYYEGIAKTNDSILQIASLPEEKQRAFYLTYIEELKQKEKEAQEQLEKQKEAGQNKALTAVRTNNGLSSSKTVGDAKTVRNQRVNSPKSIPGSRRQSNFYFYNQQTVAYGKNEFLTIWGDRERQDNWRLSDTKARLKTEEKNDTTEDDGVEDARFNVDTYLAQIPKEQKELDSISKERNYAYYQLGNIYRAKFKELELSKARFETLLQNNPEDRLILPSKYNLYKLYLELGLTAEAERMKQDIITNYPESRYAEILLNPESELSKDENSPEVIYTRLYEQFSEQNYQYVITEAEKQIKRLEGDSFVPKFEILKASAKGRLFGLPSYKEGINYIALNYSNTEEGKKAQKILTEAIPMLEKKDFISDDQAQKFNVVYQFEKDSGEDIDAFVKVLDEEVAKIDYFDLTTSKDIYNENTIFVVVHGLKSIEGASGFAEFLKSEEKDNRGRPIPPKITKPYFAISSPNYTIVQRHKNLEEYLNPQ